MLSRFNPTLVRLKRQSPAPPPYPLVGFNPTLVRLKQWPHRIEVGEVLGFNPTLVRLKLSPSAIRYIIRSSFNPTLVRLKPKRELPTKGTTPKFQSHTGPIKTFDTTDLSAQINQFQSHTGPIKTPPRIFAKTPIFQPTSKLFCRRISINVNPQLSDGKWQCLSKKQVGLGGAFSQS